MLHALAQLLQACQTLTVTGQARMQPFHSSCASLGQAIIRHCVVQLTLD
jgi:hypothetical protein